jgi:hypothetical protein
MMPITRRSALVGLLMLAFGGAAMAQYKMVVSNNSKEVERPLYAHPWPLHWRNRALLRADRMVVYASTLRDARKATECASAAARKYTKTSGHAVPFTIIIVNDTKTEPILYWTRERLISYQRYQAKRNGKEAKPIPEDKIELVVTALRGLPREASLEELAELGLSYPAGEELVVMVMPTDGCIRDVACEARKLVFDQLNPLKRLLTIGLIPFIESSLARAARDARDIWLQLIWLEKIPGLTMDEKKVLAKQMIKRFLKEKPHLRKYYRGDKGAQVDQKIGN